MKIVAYPWLDPFTTVLAFLLFAIGLTCLLTQRNAIKQIIGLKIMLQGVTLTLILAGHKLGDMRLAQAMVISALVVETVAIAIGIALIVNIFRAEASGDVDQLTQLRG